MLNDKHNISVVLITLNDEKFIKQCLLSIKDSNILEIIIVDGGSTDKTLQIAQTFKVKTYVSKKGMMNQTLFGIKKSVGDLILLAEADHFYPKGAINELKNELLNSSLDGIQGLTRYDKNSNFFEIGHSELQKLRQSKPGNRYMISGTQLWRTKKLVSLFSKITNGQNYSFDTERAEVVKKIKLKTAIGRTIIFDTGSIDLKRCLKRHLNYGYGDYDFLVDNKNNFNFMRKIFSLTHVLRTYFFLYPFASILTKKFYILIPYSILIGFIRYYGFFSALFSKTKKEVNRP